MGWTSSKYSQNNINYSSYSIVDRFRRRFLLFRQPNSSLSILIPLKILVAGEPTPLQPIIKRSNSSTQKTRLQLLSISIKYTATHSTSTLNHWRLVAPFRLYRRYFRKPKQQKRVSLKAAKQKPITKHWPVPLERIPFVRHEDTMRSGWKNPQNLWFRALWYVILKFLRNFRIFQSTRPWLFPCRVKVLQPLTEGKGEI